VEATNSHGVGEETTPNVANGIKLATKRAKPAGASSVKPTGSA